MFLRRCHSAGIRASVAVGNKLIIKHLTTITDSFGMTRKCKITATADRLNYSVLKIP